MIGHTALILALTLLTQLGGIAWAIALLFRRRLLSFALAYSVLWTATYALSPVPPCPVWMNPCGCNPPSPAPLTATT
jgi:hypothetical protein